MSYQFKTNFLILTKQVVSATGNSLYVNGIECCAGVSGNLTQTGVLLNNQINSLSGFVTGLSGFDLTNFATVVNLTQTGITIEGQLSSLSGWAAPNINLGTTGSSLYNYLNNGSGALLLVIQSTGSNLYNYLSNLSGQFNTNFATQINLTTTGQTLYNYANGIGTNLSGTLTQSGISLQNIIYGGDNNISGNLTLTGQTNRNLTIGGDTNLSGNLQSTGQLLYSDLTGLSGQANINYATATNLTTTGITLRNLTIGGDTNLSGQLTTTGSTLYINLTGLSGQFNTNFAPSINNYVYRTGDQLITGVKSFNDSTLFYNNLRFNVSNITGNFNFTSGSYRYVWTGNYQWTGTLPSYTTYSGFEFMVKHGGTTGTNLSLSGLIDYSNNATMIPYQSLNIWSNGQSWILN